MGASGHEREVRFHLANTVEVEQFSVKQVPPKTMHKKGNIYAWMENRNSIPGTEPCPHDLLKTQNVVALNYWLKVFAMEARKANGNHGGILGTTGI